MGLYVCVYIYTGGARIIERSQEYKSTVKYRTFVLLRVPIPRGVGKFNYRTGIRSTIKFPRSIKFLALTWYLLHICTYTIYKMKI